MQPLARRLLRALLEPAGDGAAADAELSGTSDRVALLRAGGHLVAIVDHPGDETLPALAARLAEVQKVLERGTLHLLVTGGGGETVRALATAAPRFQFRRHFGLHHVDEAGRYAWIDGPRLALLQFAAERAVDLPPITDTELARPAVAASPEALRERSVAAALSTGFPTVTAALAIGCILVFLLELWWGKSGESLAFLRLGANRGELVRQGQFYRLLASALLHGGFAHIVFNLLALLSFGPLLERVLGARRYLVLYVLSALGGSLASAYGHPDVTSVGASGALWGLMAAGGGLALRPRDLLSPGLVQRMRKQVWAPVIFNGLYSLRPGIDLLAHLGGGLVGIALIVTGLLTAGLAPVDAPPPREGRASLPLAVLAALALAGSAVWAVAAGRPWELTAPPPSVRIPIDDTGLSLELPPTLIRSAIEQKNIASFGDLFRDPAAFELVLVGRGDPRDGQDLDREIALLRDDMDKNGLEGAVRVGNVRVEQIDGRPTVVREERFPRSGIRILSFGTVLWDRELILRAYVHPDASPAWRALPEAALHSLAAEGAAGDQRSCDAGDGTACALLARVAFFGRAGVARDLGRATALWERGCDGRHAPSCTAAGLSYEKGDGVPVDTKRAIDLYRRSCDGGDGEGCYDLALALEHGIAGPRDDASAVPLYQKACDSKYFEACTNLAAFYQAGRSVPRDDARAKSLRNTGCDGGDPLACKLLGRPAPPEKP